MVNECHPPTGPVEHGGLPGLVPVIFETFRFSQSFSQKEAKGPGGFKTTMKVESLWLLKRSTGPGTWGLVHTIFWDKALKIFYFLILSTQILRQSWFVPSMLK